MERLYYFLVGSLERGVGGTFHTSSHFYTLPHTLPCNVPLYRGTCAPVMYPCTEAYAPVMCPCTEAYVPLYRGIFKNA